MASSARGGGEAFNGEGGKKRVNGRLGAGKALAQRPLIANKKVTATGWLADKAAGEEGGACTLGKQGAPCHAGGMHDAPQNCKESGFGCGPVLGLGKKECTR